MQLVNYRASETGTPRLGALIGDRVVDLEAAGQAIGAELPAAMADFIALGDAGLDRAEQALASGAGMVGADVRLLAPIPPQSKNLFCVGRNYREHIIEAARALGVDVAFPPAVELFSKPPTTVIGPEAPIEWDPAVTQKLDYEVELAFVIGTRGANIAVERAMDHVYGFTAANDVSARDLQFLHGQWFKGKALDTFCPIGPTLVPRRYVADPHKLGLRLRVNGETRQDSTTADLLFRIPEIVAQLSAGLTLQPGDIVLTGTPSGVALGMPGQPWLKDGDLIEIEIDGIGLLRNRVQAVRSTAPSAEALSSSRTA